MSFLLEDHSTTCSDEEFYSVIEYLKSQNVLPQHSFVQSLPFFNFSHISKESQIKELFETSCDPSQYKALLQNVLLRKDAEPETFSTSLNNNHVMSFAQVALYKVLACPQKDCPGYPREIATHNQYTDPEFECPFYHHERDRRRMVITTSMEEEFVYKANYYEEGRRSGDKDKYSQNYFESMFHPLYYKMFKCKRHYCNSTKLCPFFHMEDEKRSWDRAFSDFVKKDRASYVKDKQKFYEGSSNNTTNRMENNENVNRNHQHQHQHYRRRTSNTKTNNKRQDFQQQPDQAHYLHAEKPKQYGRKLELLDNHHAFFNKSKEQEVC